MPLANDGPREMTYDEVMDTFLSQIKVFLDFWLNEERAPDARAKMEGLAFSILSILDGTTSIPGFIVAPSPHPGDKEFHRNDGDNWWPENEEVRDLVEFDLSGFLHEEFSKKFMRKGD